MIEKPKIEELEINKIIPYVNNQKKHPDEQIEKIVASIKEFGYINPIIIDKDNVIIAGHGRYEALKRLGYKKIPVLRADNLTKAQVMAYRIADNKLAELAEWDEELLRVDIERLKQDYDFDIDLLGFDEDELEEILQDLKDEDELDDTEYEKADEVPEIDEENIVIKRGDLIELGEHRLLCGDSMSEKDIKKLMNGVKADIVFTDPDYAMDNDEWINVMLKFVKKGHPIFIMASDKQHIRFANLIPNFRIFFAGIKKNALLLNNNMPMCQHTLVSFYCEHPAKFFINKKDNFRDVFEYKRIAKENEEKEGHRHHKSVDVPKLFIEHYSKKGSIVLDLFGGSGSTLIASDILKRICYMCEIEPKYVQLIIQRYCEYKGRNEVKINGELVDWNEYNK